MTAGFKSKLKFFAVCASIAMCLFFVTPVTAGAAEKKVVAKPRLDVSFVYDGTPKTVSAEQSKYYVSESVTCINAGIYEITVSLIDKNLYCWDDYTSDDLKLRFEIKKAYFDVESLSYEDETYVWDGKEHYINVKGLPSFASVIFNTVKSEPGVYESMARIDLGKNYENRIITLGNANLTILAVELKDDGGSFIDMRGINPDMEFTLGKGQNSDFRYALPAGGGLYAEFAPKASLYGKDYEFEKGDYRFRIFVPSRYTGVKVYVNDGGRAKETEVHWDGHYVVFGTDKMCEFAVVYSGFEDDGQPQLLWLEILLGALIAAEIAVIVRMALILSKKKK